uniref:Anaphase-promoting complex subunit 2 n=1 Tax=Haemonchus contortus TaxID=6289 RepID=A0A7I4YF68_HAECO|nr:Cullin domain containing protein [Haemonchus contortus]
MVNDQHMTSIPQGSRLVSVKNPFGKKDFTVKIPDGSLQTDSTWEFRAIAAVRWFIADTLKPHMMVWFSGLPSKFSNKELADEVKCGLCATENCINELLSIVMADNPLQNFSEKIWRHVPDLLFPRHDWAEWTRRLMPLMINHFTSIRCMNVVEANTCRRDPLEQGDFFDHILSKRSGKLEKRRFTANAMRETIAYMIEGRFQLNDLVTAVIHATYVKVGKAYIEHVLERTGGLTIEQMEEIYEVLWAWLSTIPLTDKGDLSTIQDLGKNALMKAIIDRLTDSIYDMAVVNFPKSYPTLSTLRKCMISIQEYGREKLVNTLINDVETQLLHIAVDTPAILNGYSLCVESLRELDPSCVIMHRVCKVIKEYLKGRPDTVRQIINYITSEKRDDLAAHLANRCGTIVDEDELTGANDDFLPEAMNLSQWRHWMPDPIDVGPGESGRFRQAADVFNMLVSVYGSKEMFVKEYRQLLAERLTSSNTKDPIFERRYLDLLKLRFNEGELQQCEVMLKDIRDSQRIDRTALGRKCVPVSACVISSHFWPKINSETVPEFPPVLEEALVEYEKSFMDHKESRRLQWLRAVGCVEVTLKLGDVEVDKVVPNPIAAVLYLYLEKESWTVSEVSERLSISKGVARRRLEWWRSQGLLSQSLPTGATAEEWSLVTNPNLLATSRGAADDESDEDEGAIEETTDAIDALEQYWSYTKNFIANHDNGEVKAERMHRIYRMFSSPSAQGPSLETVTAFLMKKVKMNLLTYNNGFFRVVKENATKTGER